jgi:hypothetical protein
MKLAEFHRSTRLAVINAAGYTGPLHKISGMLQDEIWRAFHKGLAVVIDNVSSSTDVVLTEFNAAQPRLPVLRHGFVVVDTVTDTLFGGKLYEFRTCVMGISRTYRPQMRWVAATVDDLLTTPSDYRRFLPALSIYGVPWEIAWLRSPKARAAAIRAYQKAAK